METALGLTMAVGIFVVAPALIGFGILGTVILREHRHLARTQRYQAATALQQEGIVVGKKTK